MPKLIFDIETSALPLENFDAIGRWRTTDRQANDAAINASSVLPNGIAIEGPAALRAQLTSRPNMFAQAVTEINGTPGEPSR